MKDDKTKTIQKGSEQPPTRVGLDDERSKTGFKDDKKRDDKKGSITDQVMEDQSKHHEVQRT